MSYSFLERRLARVLDSAPQVRRAAKWAYQRLNYLVEGRGGQRLMLHDRVSIRTHDEWAGTSSEQGRAATFYGYYDISPWSADQSRILVHVLERDNDSRLRISVAERNQAHCMELGTTRAWNFQQGSLAQWMPDGQSVIFNDVMERNLVARIVSIAGGERLVRWPVQAVRSDGNEALSLNYRRLARLRPEYGYDVDVENFTPDQPLDEDGIWTVDLRSGESQLVISLGTLAEQDIRPEMHGAQHKVNHIVYSPGGSRFVFMHRWFGSKGKFSRLYCANGDGTGLRLLLDTRMVSHYSWRDDDTLLVWARTREEGDRYYLLNVVSGVFTVIGRDQLDTFGDGHPSFSPDRQWIVTDTYPDRARRRHLFLYHPGRSRLIEVGAFFAPWRYDGSERCDLHPRWSPDGRMISIDSAHEGVRRNYVIDVSKLVL